MIVESLCAYKRDTNLAREILHCHIANFRPGPSADCIDEFLSSRLVEEGETANVLLQHL